MKYAQQAARFLGSPANHTVSHLKLKKPGSFRSQSSVIRIMRFVNNAKTGAGWTSFIMKIMAIFGLEPGHHILRVTTNLRS